ncbi:MAG: hypothetical protein R3F14_24940 [Polyangiaceae bacterium]
MAWVAVFGMGCGEQRPPWWDPTSDPGDGEGGGASSITGDGSATCQSGAALLCPEGGAWSLGTGSAADESRIRMGIDCENNVIVGGDFPVNVDFGGEELESSSNFGGVRDLYLAKLAADGTHLWSRSFGDERNQLMGALAVDSQGAIFLGGSFEGQIDFGGATLFSEAPALYLAKLDADGELMFARAFSMEAKDVIGNRIRTMVVDDKNRVWIGGVTDGTTDFGDGMLTGSPENMVFIATFDTDGNHLWSRAFGSPGWGQVDRFSLDHSGNMLVTGAYAGPLDLGGGAPPEVPDSKFGTFVMKVDSEGGYVWHRFFASKTNVYAQFVAASDSMGNALLAGSISGDVDLGGPTVGESFPGNGDLVLAKYDVAGNHVWSEIFSGSDPVTFGWAGASAIAVDKEDQIVVSGFVYGEVNLGGQVLTQVGSGKASDPFVIEVDPSGTVTKTKVFGGKGSAYPWEMRLDSAGTAVLAGTFKVEVDFGQGAIHGDGINESDDLFVASYPR